MLKTRLPIGLGVIASLALVGTAAFPAAPAQAAPTEVPITVTADAYATDGSGQITSNQEFLWDSAKGNDPEDAYQIAYRGNLDMKSVWSQYQIGKILWSIGPGNTPERWAEKTFTGEWNISFTVDTSVVSVNPEFVSCEALQHEILTQNSGTSFGEFMRCTEVSFSESTGQYSANFELKNADGSRVKAPQLDANQPSSLHLTTPSQALYVQQDKFEAGKTFTMTEPTVSGQMAMDAFYIGMPMLFEATGNSVPLTMTETHDALFSFEASGTSRELPAAVLDLLPATQTMVQNGEEVTPPAPLVSVVTDGQGSWHFAGWQPESQVMSGQNLNFVGLWEYEVNPDAQFTVRFSFTNQDGTGGAEGSAAGAALAASGGSALPPAVLELLPAEFLAQQGITVQPEAPTLTSVKTDSGEWAFAGWTPESVVIDGADVEFVGSWAFTPKPTPPSVTPTPKPTPEIARTGSQGLAGLGITAAALFAVGAAMFLLRRRTE